MRIPNLAYRWRFVTMLVFALVVVSCAGSDTPSEISPTASPTPTIEPGLENVLDQLGLDGTTRQLLVRDWLSTPSAATLVLQVGVAQALSTSQPNEPLKPLDIIHAARRQPWYLDGVNDDDVAILGAALIAYGNILRLRDRRAPPVSSVIEALNSHQYVRLSLPEGTNVVVFLVSDPAVPSGPLLADVETFAVQIEEISGEADLVGLTMLRLRSDEPRCYTSGPERNRTIVLDRVCTTYATVHELLHVFIGTEYPTWYTEGIAHFYAALLTGRGNEYAAALRDSYGASPRFELNGTQSGSSPEGVSSTIAGELFLFDVYSIIGPDAMKASVRIARTNEYTNGDKLLDTFRRVAPPGTRARVDALIAERVIR